MNTSITLSLQRIRSTTPDNGLVENFIRQGKQVGSASRLRRSSCMEYLPIALMTRGKSAKASGKRIIASP